MKELKKKMEDVSKSLVLYEISAVEETETIVV